MRLSSIVSLVVVTASLALGGCAADGEPAVGEDAPNVVHSDTNGGVPNQRNIAEIIAIGNGKVAPELGKVPGSTIPISGLGVDQHLGLVAPHGLTGIDDGRAHIPALAGEEGLDPTMKLVPVETDGSGNGNRPY